MGTAKSPKNLDNIVDESCSSDRDCRKKGKKCHDAGCICKNGKCVIKDPEREK